MKDRGPEIKDDNLERLIDAEVDSALAKFRSGRFEADVRKRIDDTAVPAAAGKRSRSRFRAAWIGAAAGLAAASAAILILFPRTPGPAMVQAIGIFLRQTPGIAALESRDLAGREARESTIPSPMNVRIQEALAAGHRQSEETPLSPTEPSDSQEGRKVRLMTIEEIYKILIIDKSIERVLAHLS